MSTSSRTVVPRTPSRARPALPRPPPNDRVHRDGVHRDDVLRDDDSRGAALLARRRVAARDHQSGAHFRRNANASSSSSSIVDDDDARGLALGLLARDDVLLRGAPAALARRGRGARPRRAPRVARPLPAGDRRRQGAFYTLVPIRPHSRGERRSLRTFLGASLRPPLAFSPRPRRLSTPTDAFQLHPVDKAAARRDAKDALLDAIATVERGVTATEADKEAIDALAVTLERLNPNARALSCNLLNGEWELLYTTSASIIGANKPWPFRPLGPIYQTIDVPRLRAANRETFPFFNAVDADLTPTSAAAVDVQFVKFKLFGGLIRVDAPAAARGALRCVLYHTGPHTTPFAW